MSDAIVLDVLSSSPVQLDAGDADPIAREEIAALATRVTTVEGDVSGLSTRMGAVEGDVTALDGRMDAAEGDISTLGTTVDGIDARVEAIEADYVTAEDVMGALGGEAPALVSGSSRAMLGDPETASWMQRTTAADGAAVVESVKGNTLVWNQLVTSKEVGVNHAFAKKAYSDGVTTATVTAVNPAASFFSDTSHKLLEGNKLLLTADVRVTTTTSYSSLPIGFMPSSAASGGNSQVVNVGSWQHLGIIIALSAGAANYSSLYVYYAGGFLSIGDTVEIKNMNVFDLTAMFGAGNEPSTVAEFEALFPDTYYPYDAGSLLPVRMEGVETVGFNQWDEVWVSGYINNDGTATETTHQERTMSANYIPVLPNTEYCISLQGDINRGRSAFYDSDWNFILFKADFADNWTKESDKSYGTFTTPANASYMKFCTAISYGTTYNHDICINLSDPARNGTYEPYWQSQRAIDVATYFPDGMRSAGTVRDELRADAAVTRIGERAYQSGDESDASVITDGTVTYYALATASTTPIDPPLPMSYRVDAGGTERVMVASGTTSAPPIFATRYPLDPADLAASIAPVDGHTATTNHQVGDLLMLGFTLCKVTTAIATGETIAIGTNVTKTTVAAEIAALS